MGLRMFAMLLLAPLPAAAATGQCLLANPSFELPGDGQIPGDWNPFGDAVDGNGSGDSTGGPGQ